MLKDVDTLEMDLKGVPMVLNNQELAKLFGAKNGEQVSRHFLRDSMAENIEMSVVPDKDNTERKIEVKGGASSEDIRVSERRPVSAK